MPRSRPGPRAAGIVLSAALLALSACPVRAEIYQWADETGTIHFTDDLSSVPPSVRNKARLLLREAPITIKAAPGGATAGSPPRAAGSDAGITDDFDDMADPVTLAEQLRAKIAAKEQLIESVDRKRSLATGLKNRFVSPSDMELYRKYQAELPGDRERLREVEARIDALGR